MKHLKGFNLYNEGLFNYIRSKRFKDDDIIQNLIKIINNSNYIDVTLLIDVHEGDDIFYQKDITKYNVSIEKENINFDITENVITEYDMSINITRNYEVKIDELVLRSSAKEVGLTNIKKLFNIINDNYNDSTKRYFPDIYIKSTNTIIEVKSDYFYFKDKLKNDAKRQACLDKQFNFNFIIYGKNNERSIR